MHEHPRHSTQGDPQLEMAADPARIYDFPGIYNELHSLPVTEVNNKEAGMPFIAYPKSEPNEKGIPYTFRQPFYH